MDGFVDSIHVQQFLTALLCNAVHAPIRPANQQDSNTSDSCTEKRGIVTHEQVHEPCLRYRTVHNTPCPVRRTW